MTKWIKPYKQFGLSWPLGADRRVVIFSRWVCGWCFRKGWLFQERLGAGCKWVCSWLLSADWLNQDQQRLPPKDCWISAISTVTSAFFFLFHTHLETDERIDMCRRLQDRLLWIIVKAKRSPCLALKCFSLYQPPSGPGKLQGLSFLPCHWLPQSQATVQFNCHCRFNGILFMQSNMQ